MLPGLTLIAIGGLLLWAGFTGRSPLDEIQALLAGEPIFVRDEESSLIPGQGGTFTGEPSAPPSGGGGGGGGAW